MALTKHPCKNHPDRFTAKKCFYCKQPICNDCSKNYFHHIFCSFKCALQWKIKDIFSVFQVSKELTWFIIVVVLSNIIMYNLISSRFEEKKTTAARSPEDSTAIFPAPEGFLIDSIRYAIQGKFKIRVAAEKNLVLTLVQNGKFVESLLPSEIDFSFNDVVLKNGLNTFSVWGLNPTGKSVLVDSFSITYKAPRLDYLMSPVYKIRTDQKNLALTFDGGSSNTGTNEILDILKKQNIQCTMFLTGQFIQDFPDLVERIIKDGHEIGNHSLTHPHFTNLEINGQNTSRLYVNRKYLQSQLNKTDSIFYAHFTKHMMPYWRAPFGEINREILFWAAELGYRHIGWSYRCDSWDWVEDKSSKLYRTAAQIEDHFLQMENKDGLQGKIILMHLGSERKDDYPYLILDDLISSLKARGYSFKKISALLKK